MEANYGRTVRTITMPFGYVYRMGPEIMCTDFCDIWTFRWWFLAFLVKRAPPTNFGSQLLMNGKDYQYAVWIYSSHGSIDHVYRFVWDLDKIWRKRSKKCVLKKIQNCGKSILTQMGVAYMERCVMSQWIQGKNNFNFTTYGSRVIRQKVKRAVIAPPWGRSTQLFFN